MRRRIEGRPVVAIEASTRSASARPRAACQAGCSGRGRPLRSRGRSRSTGRHREVPISACRRRGLHRLGSRDGEGPRSVRPRDPARALGRVETRGGGRGPCPSASRRRESARGRRSNASSLCQHALEPCVHAFGPC